MIVDYATPEPIDPFVPIWRRVPMSLILRICWWFPATAVWLPWYFAIDFMKIAWMKVQQWLR